MEKEIANIAAVTKNGQKQIVSEMKANKGILLEVLAYAMKTRPNSLGCVFCLKQKWPLSGPSQQITCLRFLTCPISLKKSWLLFSLFPMV